MPSSPTGPWPELTPPSPESYRVPKSESLDAQFKEEEEEEAAAMADKAPSFASKRRGHGWRRLATQSSIDGREWAWQYLHYPEGVSFWAQRWIAAGHRIEWVGRRRGGAIAEKRMFLSTVHVARLSRLEKSDPFFVLLNLLLLHIREFVKWGFVWGVLRSVDVLGKHWSAFYHRFV